MQIAPIKAEGMALHDPHPGGKSTIFGLQALRFIAAAMVVVTHALNREVVVYNPHPWPRAPWMESGVDIFFVISGFIMVYILKPDTKPGAFWLQRFTRIAPLYWTATVIAFLGGLVLPEWFFGNQGWWVGLESLLFMPLANTADAHPLISPGWTLVFEFAFYTILTLCLFVRRPPFVLAGIVIMAILVGGFFLRDYVPWLGFYASYMIIVEFIFGMAVANIVRRLSMLPWQGLLIAAVGFALIYNLWGAPGAWPRGLGIGIPALIIVAGFLASEPIWQRHGWMRQFARLGDASYSIYIVHYFLVSAIATWFQKSQWVHDSVGPYGFTLLIIVAGIGSGLLAHMFIEVPLLKLVRSWLPRREPRRVLAAAKV